MSRRSVIGLSLLGGLGLVLVALPLTDWRREQVPWDTVSPAAAGMNGAKLDALRRVLDAKRTRALLIVRHDKIVFEWYTPFRGASYRHGVASVAKALVGGMSLLVALNDGWIRLDDPALKYIPAWSEDPAKAMITIRHLATHSSGIPHDQKDHETVGTCGHWGKAFWTRRPDPFSLTLRCTPLLFAAGTSYAYSGPAFAALAYAVTTSLKNAPESDIYTLLKKRIMDPLGVPESHWAIGYGEVFEVDGLQLYATWGGASYSARATARVGQLLLHKGEWKGRKLLDPNWIDVMVSYLNTPLPESRPGGLHPGPALGWWSNFNGAWPSLPRDAYAGAGANHQILLVVPSLDLIVVRYGRLLDNARWGKDYWIALERNLFKPIMDSMSQTTSSFSYQLTAYDSIGAHFYNNPAAK